MCRTTLLMISLCIILSIFWSAEPDADETQYWPQWRRPTATGSAPDSNPPVEWSEQRNIRWKARLSGTGYSTPVIWENDIFVSAAIPPENYTPPGRREKPKQPIKYILMAVDRTNGKVRWERVVREEIPHEGQHDTSTWATSSPITDGEHVYAFFGSRGLYCFDMQGNLIWEKDLGKMKTKMSFGEGSSPVLH